MQQGGNKRPAQLFGERLRLADSNSEVIQAMWQLRQKKKDQRMEDEMETASCKTRFLA